MKIIGLYASTLVLYALLDLGFIGLFASDFIRRQVGPKLAPAPDWAAAGVFYFLFAAALLYFCVLPAQSGARALFNGAFFGLVAYGTYELVNRALLADWPWPMVAVDMAWGTVMCAAVSWGVWRIGQLWPA